MRTTLTLLSMFLASGCREPRGTAQLEKIYGPSAKTAHIDRNPIIVIPGVLGSRLVDEKRERLAWGAFGPDGVDHGGPDGWRSLALPLDGGDDGVRADEVLSELRVSLGFDLEFEAYATMLTVFGIGGFVDEGGALDAVDYGPDHFTCFQFPYDWRRSCADNAARLDRFIERKRRYVARERERRYGDTSPVKFNLIAHSMGGLVARYHARYGAAGPPEAGEPVPWRGTRHIDKLILVGTPHLGSVYAFADAVEGMRLSPFLPRLEPAVIGTMPSAYELLPPAGENWLIDTEGEPLDLYDVRVWRERGFGLLDPAQDEVLAALLPAAENAAARRERAAERLKTLLGEARAFHRALHRPAPPPQDLEMFAFAGDAASTASRARLGPEGGLDLIDYVPGDGVVTRASALREPAAPSARTDEAEGSSAWTAAYFVSSDHVRMTRDPAFADNVLYLLLQRP